MKRENNMSKSLKNTLKSTALTAMRLPRRLARDNRGVAAIEFALIAPVMIAFYFGLSEVSMAIAADRNVAHATSVAGDLTTQATKLDKLEVEDVMTAAVAVMGIDASERGDLTIELNSYRKPSGGGATELIGYARLGPAISAGGPATFDPDTLGNNMLNATSGVVVARVNFKYKPVTYAFMKNVTLNETFALKPRKSLSVPFDDGTGKSTYSCSVLGNLKVTCSAS